VELRETRLAPPPLAFSRSASESLVDLVVVFVEFAGFDDMMIPFQIRQADLAYASKALNRGTVRYRWKMASRFEDFF